MVERVVALVMKTKQTNVKEHKAPVIFIDEWAKASPEVMRTALKIMLSRKLRELAKL